MIKVADMGTAILDRYIVFFEKGTALAFLEEGAGEPIGLTFDEAINMTGKEVALDDCPQRIIQTVQRLREMDWADHGGDL